MKLDFTTSAPRPKTLEEAQEIIEALWIIIGAQQGQIEALKIQVAEQQVQITEQQKKIDALEEKLRTNSNNSSKPPSADVTKKKKNNQKTKSGRKPGGQPGRTGVSRRLLPVAQVDHIEVCKPIERCPCGSRIKLSNDYVRHQVHEIPQIKAAVTEYQLHEGICKGCGKKYQASLPSGVPTGMLGAQAMAKVAVLTGDYRMSKRNVVHLFQDFYGLVLSVGTISNTEKRVSAALEAPVEEAKAFIPKQPVVNADETSHKEKNKKCWTWVCIASLVAVFIIRPSRGAKVIKELLGETFKGILCTDRWSGYAWMASAFRQLCWAHLKRDFQKISEREGVSKRIGLDLLACQKEMFVDWHHFREGLFSREIFKKRMEPIRDKVEALLNEGANCAHQKTAGTCQQILKVKEALWTFIEIEGVEPTNNIAEQVLRNIVIWRKTSFGTQSSIGTRYLERIMTVVTSCKLQKRNVLNFVTEAVIAHLNQSQAPSLLPIL